MIVFRSTVVTSLVLLASATDQVETASPISASPVTLAPGLVTFAPFTVAPAEPPITPVADPATTTPPVTPVAATPFAPFAPVVPSAPTIGPLPPGISLPPALSVFPDLGLCAVCGEGNVVEMPDVMISVSGFNFTCGEAQLAGEVGAFPTFACVSEVTNGIILPTCGCVSNTTETAPTPAPAPTPGAAPAPTPGAAPGTGPASDARVIASLSAAAVIGSLLLQTMLHIL